MGAIPKDLRAFKKNAACLLPDKDDVLRENLVFDTKDLMQTQQRAISTQGDVCALVEEILCSVGTSIPEDHVYLDPGGLPQYEFESGETAYGPEVHQTKRAAELQKTAPYEATPIFLIAWSDETDAPSGSRHVFRITLGNISVQSRFKDAAIRLAAILPQIQIRKPKGGSRRP